MKCWECHVNLAGVGGYCPQCVTNRLLRDQIDQAQRKEFDDRYARGEPLSSSSGSSELVGGVIFRIVFPWVAIISPVFFGETIVGKIFVFLWKMLWNIVSFPFWLLGKLLGIDW